MEYILYSTVTGVFIILSFIVGLHYGSKIANHQIIELPRVEPVKAIKKAINEHKEEKQAEKDKAYYNTLAENIENYPYNQKEVKR